MDLRCYLAMTAAEFQSCSNIPQATAWMACHFSGYGTGLSNLPDAKYRPKMVILNDRMPPRFHDKIRICDQLNRLSDQWDIQAYLLDLQHPGITETEDIVCHLAENLCKPTAVTEAYAHCSKGAVFVSMPPPHQPLSVHIRHIKQREIWLELAIEAEMLTFTPDSCKISAVTATPELQNIRYSPILHSQYHIQTKPDHAIITCLRQPPQVAELMEEAKDMGIGTFIGLYQQLGNFPTDRQTANG